MIVEICANSAESAVIAEQAGADRVELCSELGVGGITPSLGLLEKIKETLTIPAHVLIRPRSGDFSYSDSEFDIMLSDIDRCVEMGFEGIVCGVLNRDLSLDTLRTAALVERAAGLQFTFHRAYDWVTNPIQTLTELEAIGVDNILTSGQAKSARQGMPLLEKLLQKAVKSTIIPAAGIRSETALKLKQKGFSTIHLSGVKKHITLPSPPGVPMISKDLIVEDAVAVTDHSIIEEVIKTVK
jgi:copper homeostasis protein